MITAERTGLGIAEGLIFFHQMEYKEVNGKPILGIHQDRKKIDDVVPSIYYPRSDEMWEAALALAKIILAEREKLEAAAADEALANMIINAIKAAIEQSTRQIIEFLKQQHLDVLASDIEGLFVTFIRYAADPRAEGNHERLIRIIDDLAKLIPDMGRTLDRIGSEESLAVNTFPTYASAVALSVLAITEQRNRFQVKEPYAGILEEGKRRALLVKNALRRRSDMRFRFAVQYAEPGFVNFGYFFGDEFYFVALAPTGGSGKRQDIAAEKVHREMSQHQDRAFLDFSGVKELLAFLEDLDVAIIHQVYLIALQEIAITTLDLNLGGGGPGKVMYVAQRVLP